MRRLPHFRRVPRYFFDLHNDLEVIDEEGCDLADLAAAKEHALAEAREMIQASASETGKIDLCHRIDVRDESGGIVHSLRFEDAVSFVRDGRPA